MADQSLDIADEVQYVIGSVFVWLGPKIRMSVFLVFAAELKININSVTVIFWYFDCSCTTLYTFEASIRLWQLY